MDGALWARKLAGWSLKKRARPPLFAHGLCAASGTPTSSAETAQFTTKTTTPVGETAGRWSRLSETPTTPDRISRRTTGAHFPLSFRFRRSPS